MFHTRNKPGIFPRINVVFSIYRSSVTPGGNPNETNLINFIYTIESLISSKLFSLEIQ